MNSHHWRSVFTASLSLLLTASSHLKGATQPPPGFTPLFNGKDLQGWWGAETEDPRKYMALSPEEFKMKHDGSLDDIQKYWRAENDELVKDGKGLYLTTDRFSADFELLIDYRTVPLADSGIYLHGCPQ